MINNKNDFPLDVFKNGMLFTVSETKLPTGTAVLSTDFEYG